MKRPFRSRTATQWKQIDDKHNTIKNNTRTFFPAPEVQTEEDTCGSAIHAKALKHKLECSLERRGDGLEKRDRQTDRKDRHLCQTACIVSEREWLLLQACYGYRWRKCVRLCVRCVCICADVHMSVCVCVFVCVRICDAYECVCVCSCACKLWPCETDTYRWLRQIGFLFDALNHIRNTLQYKQITHTHMYTRTRNARLNWTKYS